MKVVVVGGGVVGLSSAYELASAGCEVILLEAEACGAGASHGNAAKVALAESTPVPGPGVLLQGIRWMLKPDSPLSIRPSLAPGYLKFLLRMALHCNARDFEAGLDVHLRLGEDANGLFDEYQHQGIGFEMHDRGVLLAFETAERFEEHSRSLEAFASVGHLADELHGDDLLETEPALSERIRHGLFFPADRQIEPDSLTHGLLGKLDELGVKVREGVAVRSFVRSSDTVTAVVTTDAEVIATDAVVIAAGVPTGALLAELGRRLPIYSGKGYSIDYSPAPIDLRTSLTLEDTRVAVTPLNGMLRLAGTMEFGSRDDEVNDIRVEAIRRAARQSFRDWGDEPTGERAPWAGSRPMTPDGLPVIGSLGTAKNAYVNSGHSMLGLTLAPASAKVLADIMLGRKSTLSSDLLARISPKRF
ncbi:MAG: FAD-dependent oxidoreductase [Brevibacterium sp.]|nr:FAD-dependent oxidoreductase [Brevibacterium sp.]MDN5833167.1 FAD-dependent oxidoreductase [Brevibacterium sp.]MDN5876470.1 FAD-dependent oxidoreductase [Brevibacterium sp.]MDN5909993.1 FAD-dependent oxidoreductase [Brevibacterium sp.]MDN6157740.1 FAD-dependent oxidoreductase [Brevibacterium sp.]